jgi:Chaperone of endosialidase
MRMISAVFAALAMALASPIGVLGQSAQSPTSVSVPRLVNVTGVYQPADGQPPPAGTVVTLLIYADQQGGTPLWQETQNVVLDKSGGYSLLLGAAQADGIPLEVFASGEARWLALHFAGLGEVEGPRTRITSVPYALRSADADTLGGHPASAYLLAPTGSTAKGATSSSTGTAQSNSTQSNATTEAVQTGTTNMVAKYVNTTDVGNSAIYESGGLVGINTTTPSDALQVRFTNSIGTMTGLALQNMGNTATSYSGTLFYDQNGQLGQFQGFNNVTHEYRINNIAKTGVVTDGSINFMINSASKFFVSPITVGIGTTVPDTTSNLDVSNAVSGSGSTNLQISAYAANGFGSNLIGKKARGTQTAPTAVLNNDGLLTLSGTGYGASAFASVSSGVISMRASEDWTNTAQGSYMNFATTANGTTGSVNRMTINSNGNVGIGVFGAQAPLEVSNSNGVAGAGMIFASTFTSAGTSLFVGRRARGTGVAPAAVVTGDNLAGFLAQGHTGSGFSGTRGGMFVQAAENWTPTAQGTNVFFNTTATGTTTPSTKMVIDPSGNVGIGTFVPDAPLEVSRIGSDAASLMTVYTSTNAGNANPLYFARLANGTPAAPTAAQSGDILGAWIASGYGSTQFGDVTGGMGVIAQETFTDTAQGSATVLLSTAVGTVTPQFHVAVLPTGNVGIGDWAIPAGTPTAADRLQVFGDIRVGTGNTNGCLKNFGAGIIGGTCASDRRFKKNITPFGSVLDRVTALQPVHFDWRSTEFPDRHFGDSRSYGLIAQDVEEVLPELVVTAEDGFKAVDYSKLPLLTIQAVKELKSENNTLKDRVSELERIVAELLATTSKR